MLVYKRRWYEEKDREYHTEEITYEKALDIVLGTWNDTDMVRDMLLIPNRIQCRFSDILVSDVKDDGITEMVLMAGMCNMMNPNYEYDDETWNRVEG